MAYTTANFSLIDQDIGGGKKRFIYYGTDALTTVIGTSFFSDAVLKGAAAGDRVDYVKTDDPNVYRLVVTAVSGDAATAKLDTSAALHGFYGATPVSQRAGSNQASTNVVTSASFGTLQVAQLQEVYNTLAGLGLWKGSA